MKRTFTILLLIATAGITWMGCDQFALDEAEPQQSVASSQAYTSVTGFEAALIGAYDLLQNFNRYGQFWQIYPDALADNATQRGGGSGRYGDVIRNAEALGSVGEYGAMYETINLANNIITRLPNFEGIQADDPQAVKDRIRGQAFFLRGLSYFDLARIYSYEPGREVDGWNQGVILRTQPTESAGDADFRARAPNDSVYARAANDLQRAANLLEGTTLSKARGNQAAAYALLARIELYRANWSAAEEAAGNALSATTASLVGPDPEAFQAAWSAATHPESIFELSMQQGTDGDATFSNESLAALTYAECAPGECQEGEFREFNFEVSPTGDLLQTYPQGDVRRTIIDTLSNGVEVIGKYTNTIAQYTDRIPLIRVPEMYLIQAEARAEGASGDPLAPLNTLRQARGLSTLTNVTGQALIDSIMVERRRELVYEGHRWFDLKRRAQDIPKPQPAVSRSVLPYTDFRILSQLPPGEVSSNPQLEQNPGY